jgi:uncharacterized protein (DUF58 family)
VSPPDLVAASGPAVAPVGRPLGRPVRRAAGRVPVTARGWALVAASLVMTVAGSALGYPELNALGASGFMLFGLALVGVARTVSFGVERRVVPDRVPVGGLAESLVTVANEGRRRSAGALAHDVVGTTAIEIAVPSLAPGRMHTIPYRLPTDRRAVLEVGPLVVVRSDPLGLAERRLVIGGTGRLWVHPRAHAVAPLPVGRSRDLEGPTSDLARGDGSFHALREYVTGDDLRRVHWKATAHRGALMVREHADPARPDVTIVLDDRRAASAPDEFELAVEVVASVCVASRRSGFPVRLLSVSGGLDGAPLADETALLDLLAGARQEEGAFDALPAPVAVAGPAGRALVVVTGAPASRDLRRWAVAGRRFGGTIVVAVGREDGLPAAPAGVRLIRASSAAEFAAAWGRAS